jgi:tetratricopeptide (TPR) repeat protein
MGAILDQARSLVESDPGEAIRLFELAVVQENESGTASYYYGRFLFESGEYTHALEEFQESESRSGFHAGTSLLIAKCLLQLNRLEESKMIAKMILQRVPGHGGARKLIEGANAKTQ